MTMRIIVIGAGKVAIDCARIVLNRAALFNDCCLCGVVVDTKTGLMPSDESAYTQLGIDCFFCDDINHSDSLLKINGWRPDIIFSVNNHQIIDARLRNIPSSGTVNFHNAPLPRYAGLNACTWAIFNGETHHGVTWHYVDQGIDSGDIVGQVIFTIPEASTAIQLIMLCIQKGVSLFERILPDLISGKNERHPQDLSKRLFYRRTEIPHSGIIDFSWTCKQIERFIRSLDFNPLPNPLAYPRARIRDRIFFVDSVRCLAGGCRAPAGTVVSTDSDSFVVSASDGLIAITAARDERKKRIKIHDLMREYAIAPGVRLEKTSVRSNC